MQRSDQRSDPVCALRKGRLHAPLASLAPLGALLLILLSGTVPSRADSGPPRGTVLLVRGVMTIFSLGLDDLAAKLPCHELEVQVVPTSWSPHATRHIAQRYMRGELDGPLVLIGHSLGGDMLPGLARQLGASGQVVDLMIMIDATNPSDVPMNVRRCVNLYQSNFSPTWFRVFRGVPIRATNPATQLVNVDIRQFPEIQEAATLHHFNIEASDWVHQVVICEIQHLLRSRSE